MIGETILKGLVLAKKRLRPEPPRSDGQDWEQYIRWQFESSDKLFTKYPDFDIRGKRILEIGCGTGGRAAWLADRGAEEVVAIDINAAEIDVAREIVPRLWAHLSGKLSYHVAPSDGPMPVGTFHTVVLVDCLEHLVSPPSMMRLCYDYTAPGGTCWMSLPGWYHASGSHFGMVPFVNLFFSDETILNVQRWIVTRPDYQPSRFDSDPPLERWRGLYDLSQRPGEYLNKMTLAKMKKLVKHSIFPSAKMHVIGFNNPLMRVVNPLRHLPVAQEVFHSYVVLEFSK